MIKFVRKKMKIKLKFKKKKKLFCTSTLSSNYRQELRKGRKQSYVGEINGIFNQHLKLMIPGTLRQKIRESV